MEGFFLGFSNGPICLAHCLPVMAPYFMAETTGARQIAFFSLEIPE